MKLRIRYTVRGDWTTVEIRRVDGEASEEGRALFRTSEWTLLLGKLGYKGPLGPGGWREITLP